MRLGKKRFDLGSYRLTTAEMGNLYPVGVMEVLPGDEFKHSARAMVRLSPMAAPVMHNIRIRLDHFFVPTRICWQDDGEPGTFEDFMTGGPDGRDTQQQPTVLTTGVAKDVLDYLGLPVVAGVPVNAIPLRAFNRIVNEWYRDQDLVEKRDPHDTSIPKVAWEKDYFTTARPWAQKGDEVTLPLGSRAPITGLGVANEDPSSGATVVRETGGETDTYNPAWNSTNQFFAAREDPENPGHPSIFADLSSATAATINSLRRASALQRFLEERARYGSRYAEYALRAFGARPLDGRLQRPELLGRAITSASISEILQTAPDPAPGSDDRFGVGDLYGHGIGMVRGGGYRRRFTEHGFVLSVLSVRPRALYTNGIDRTFLRRTREDFFQPELAFVGQQQVLEQEVFADGTNQDEVFGWSDRYAEYRTTNSRVTGEFRGTLDYWHLGRKFAEAPALNASFVECDPSKRIFNVTDEETDSLWCVVSHSCQALRRIPKNAVGRLL